MATCTYCETVFRGTRQFCDMRCRKLHECTAKGTTAFRTRVVSPLFQRMIRAEYAAQPTGWVPAVNQNGEIQQVHRYRGYCVCVTCGKTDRWNGGLAAIHTGHFLAGRSASIVLDEDNVAPQCSHCNRYCHGRASEFRVWMQHVRGLKTIERLQQQKRKSVTFSREELVSKWLEFDDRLKKAVQRLSE